jgi:hypothetical protein
LPIRALTGLRRTPPHLSIFDPSLILNGFCKAVLKQLPMEFAVEAQKLLAVSLEGGVG